MSEPSSSAAAWSTLLEPPPQIEMIFGREDDPRLGDVIEPWRGSDSALTPGRTVLIGFPQDEGVRRNHGRPGAAAGPRALRDRLWRMTACDLSKNITHLNPAPLDLGNVKIAGSLEDSQIALGTVVAAVLAKKAIPVVMGGGHETAFGHFLGYQAFGKKVGVINLDAHLDVRPLLPSGGHSGSPFRQGLESSAPLRYVCIGAQGCAVAAAHVEFVRERGGQIFWANVEDDWSTLFLQICDQLNAEGCAVWVSLDADVVSAADVPGVSAPNPLGLRGAALVALARLAGCHHAVSSFDLVEINPTYDRDHQSANWGAAVLWSFIMGLAERNQKS